MRYLNLYAADGTILKEKVPSSLNLPDGLDGQYWGPWVPSAPTLLSTQAKMLERLAAYRYVRETTGVLIGGALVPTDRESQGQLTSAYTSLSNGLVASIDWKAEGGVWVVLGLPQVAGLAQAVAQHVQACFTNERTHAENIVALTTVEDIAAYDFSAGWP